MGRLVRKYRLLFPIALLRTTSLQRCWKHIQFSIRHGVHLYSLLPRLNNGRYSRALKSCSPSPAATGAPCSAVPRHPHQGPLAGWLSKNQRNFKLMIRDQDCTQEAVTLSIRILWWSNWCAHLCVVWSCHREPYFGHFSCGTNSNAEDHPNFLVFQYTGKITVVSLSKTFIRTTPLSSQKTAQMLFPADCALLNFFLHGDVVWRHSIDCRVDSGWECWIQVSSPVTFCERKPSFHVSNRCKRPAVTNFPAFIVQLLSLCIQRAQNLQ